MQIEVKARTFFEAAQGSWQERYLFRTSRIISINNVSFPAEPPPFSEEFLHAENLLVLYFDDVDVGQSHAMTPEQAKLIVDFVRILDPRPIIVHCTAGISCSGAVGSVLNWYFNRYLKDNHGDYLLFQLMHRDLVPNAHVRRLLLKELERRHALQEEMEQSILLRREKARLLHEQAALQAEKFLRLPDGHFTPRLRKWFVKFDCVRFSEKLVRGTPDILKYAEAKFLRVGCGVTHCGGRVLVIDLAEKGTMRQIFAQMLELAEPESYEFKGGNVEDFLAPFMSVMEATVGRSSEYVLKLLRNSPKDAAIFLLAQETFPRFGMSAIMATIDHAEKFDELFYAEYKRKKK